MVLVAVFDFSAEEADCWRLEHEAKRPWNSTSGLWRDEVLRAQVQEPCRKFCPQSVHRPRDGAVVTAFVRSRREKMQPSHNGTDWQMLGAHCEH